MIGRDQEGAPVRQVLTAADPQAEQQPGPRVEEFRTDEQDDRQQRPRNDRRHFDHRFLLIDDNHFQQVFQVRRSDAVEQRGWQVSKVQFDLQPVATGRRWQTDGKTASHGGQRRDAPLGDAEDGRTSE